jgi:hypothetical protein
MKRVRQTETILGSGRVQLRDRYVPVNFRINVFQHFDDDLPLLPEARGGLNLPYGDVAYAMMDQKPVELQMGDGRKAMILFEDTEGNFRVTGPIV